MNVAEELIRLSPALKALIPAIRLSPKNTVFLMRKRALKTAAAALIFPPTVFHGEAYDD